MRQEFGAFRGSFRGMPRGNVLRYKVAAIAAGALSAGASAAPMEFNRDIRPILSESCLQCHGQDASKREARLRLDDRANATRDREGYAAIVPGQPEKSEVFLRITSKDPDEVMPPRESHKTLTPAQIELLRQWIAEGAPYQNHWAFVPPKRPNLPSVRTTTWPRNAIDRFVLARLESEKISVSAEATPEAWLDRKSTRLN